MASELAPAGEGKGDSKAINATMHLFLVTSSSRSGKSTGGWLLISTQASSKSPESKMGPEVLALKC